MCHSPHRSRLVVSLAALFALSAAPAEAVIIYREVFAGANNASINTVGWDAQVGATAGVPASANLSTTGQGPSPNLPAINSNPLVSGDARTFHTGTVGQPHIFWTNEYTIVAAGFKLTEVRFWEFHSATSDDPQRFVARVGSNWYVTDQSTLLTGATSTDGSSLVWEEQSLNLTTATWRNLAFIPGTVLTVGTSTLLPVGDVTAFGVYLNSYSENLRFDSFELQAEVVVPETSTLALLGLGLVGLAIKTRRRRRAV